MGIFFSLQLLYDICRLLKLLNIRGKYAGVLIKRLFLHKIALARILDILIDAFPYFN